MSSDVGHPRSMRAMRLVLALLVVALGAVVGCRDLVKPEVISEESPQPFVELLVYGISAALDNALVTIDNFNYVDAEVAGEWQAELDFGKVRFVGALPSTYDIRVETIHPSDTPGWEVKGVRLDVTPVEIAYPSVPVELRLNWPELSSIGLVHGDVNVRFRFHFQHSPGGDDTHDGHQDVLIDDSGRYTGVLPWEGNFAVSVWVSSVDRELAYVYEDSFATIPDSVVVLPSPLQRQQMILLAGGESLAEGRVRLYHRRVSWPGGYSLSYPLDRTVQTDSVTVLSAEVSKLIVSWLDGPAFMPRVVHLSPENMSPGVVNVGSFQLGLHVTGMTGLPIQGATVTVQNIADKKSWLTDLNGDFKAFLMPEPIRLEIDNPGYLTRIVIVPLEGDQDITVVLEEE